VVAGLAGVHGAAVQAPIGIEGGEGGVLDVLDFIKELVNVLGKRNLLGHDECEIRGRLAGAATGCRATGRSGSRQHRRGVVPSAQLVDDGQQRLPVVRERVLDPGRQLGKGFAAHDTVFLQLAQLLGEHLARDKRQPLRQLPKATRLREVRDDDKLPLAAQHAHRAGYGAGRGAKGGVAHKENRF
nr:hypothetical protein [Tanacetum cinerariifolium]